MYLSVRSVLAAAFIFSASLTLARERLEDRSFVPQGIPTVKINSYRGLITVESTDQKDVRVQVGANTVLEGELAERVLQTLKLEWEQEGDVLILTTNDPREAIRFIWQEGQRLDLVIKVTIPRSCQLDLTTRDGSIRVGEVAGEVRVKCNRGTIFCQMVDGSVSAWNEQGDILVSRCSGDIDLTAKRGSVRAGTVGGTAVIMAVDGDIELYSALRSLRVKTDNGNATVGISRQLTGEASIKANGGTIRLKIDPAAKINLEASTVWGKVRPVSAVQKKLSWVIQSGGIGRGSMNATMNGGGPKVVARADGGYVELVGEVPLFTE